VERMWATWRMAYVGGKPPRGCVLCHILKAKRDRDTWILARGHSSLVVLNAFPYNSGHVMVLPVRHAPDLAGLTAAERADLIELLARTERAVRRAYRPQGLNIGINQGQCAGAGVPGHVHVHVLAATKVMPESLAASWKRLRAAFREEA